MYFSCRFTIRDDGEMKVLDTRLGPPSMMWWPTGTYRRGSMAKTTMGSEGRAVGAEAGDEDGGGGVAGGLPAGFFGGEVNGLDGTALTEEVAVDTRPVLGTGGAG